MCGIAGIIGDPPAPAGAERMQAALAHRGPDDQRIYRHGEVTLVHTRLAIQDIARGGQPMHLGPYTLVFNGEIYNHLELRRGCDHTFTTTSDAETLLALFAAHGEGCLDLLDGMFAFAVLDRAADTLFLARDRAGKKPLYYHRSGGRFVFASELNALTAVVDAPVDEGRILLYLRLCSFYRRQTPYRTIHELEPGSWARLRLADRCLTVRRWWDIHAFYRRPLTIEAAAAADEVEARLTASVQRRIASSDLEVGAFLSGGIDSPLITALAARHHGRLKTFTVAFEGAYDESGLARQVADRFATDHTVIRIGYAGLADELETILGHYGEPFADSSAVPSYYVSREAKKHLTVILNGDGADELFGGYRRYVPFAGFDLFAAPPTIRRLARRLLRLLPPVHDKKRLTSHLYRLCALAGRQGLGCYLSATTDIFEGFEDQFVPLDREGCAEAMANDLARLVAAPLSGLQKIMNMDFDTLLAGNLLVKMDIATMAHALEGRSPFLGKELLEFAPRLPDRLKVLRGTTKAVLRRIAARYLPEELIRQPKRGFEVPLKRWMEHDLKEMVHDLLGPSCYAARFFRPGFISAVLAKRLPLSDEKRAKILWTLLALEIWQRRRTRGRG